MLDETETVLAVSSQVRGRHEGSAAYLFRGGQKLPSGSPGRAGALGRRVGNGLQCGQVQGHAHRPQESPVQLHHAKRP